MVESLFQNSIIKNVIPPVIDRVIKPSGHNFLIIAYFRKCAVTEVSEVMEEVVAEVVMVDGVAAGVAGEATEAMEAAAVELDVVAEAMASAMAVGIGKL